MKLYTEEQVGKAIELAQKCEHDCGGVYFENGVKDVLEELTPIELPSDEEIEEVYYRELQERRELAKNFTGQVAGRHPDMFVGHFEMRNMVRGYLEAIQSLRNKIQGDKP